MREQTAINQSSSPSLLSPLVSVSIVNHGHDEMIGHLIGDLATLVSTRIEIILTQNIPTDRDYLSKIATFDTVLIQNPKPKGFGANHNAAFGRAKGEFFCVLNPDIRISKNPFPALLAELSHPKVGVSAPKIIGPTGEVEDSARRFPTVTFLARKALGGVRRVDYEAFDQPISPDWVAGMFMLFRRESYVAIGGFDENYFLYYEDVDICRRLRLQGFDIRMVPSVKAIHDARRQSRRSVRHMLWHARSMLRYFWGLAK